MKTLNDNELTDKQLAQVRTIRAQGASVQAYRDSSGNVTFKLSGNTSGLKMHLGANMQIQVPGKRGIRS